MHSMTPLPQSRGCNALPTTGGDEQIAAADRAVLSGRLARDDSNHCKRHLAGKLRRIHFVWSAEYPGLGGKNTRNGGLVGATGAEELTIVSFGRN